MDPGTVSADPAVGTSARNEMPRRNRPGPGGDAAASRASRPVAGAALLGLLAAFLGASGLEAGESDGVRWEPDLEAGLLRAAKEGRPVLLAVNAIETEAANQRLAGEIYPSAAWGDATRDWVAFVGNPNAHGGAACSRYGGIPCATHQAVLRYVVRRFAPGGDLISPQHLVLDPDGRLAFRKEYFTGVVGPDFFDRWLARLCPTITLDRAARRRPDTIDALGAAPVEKVTDTARAWLRSGDPLAPAGVLDAMDYAMEEPRRVALALSFDATPKELLAVPWTAAYDAAVAPDDAPERTLAFVTAFLLADPGTGADLAARAAVLTRDASLSSRVLAAWVGGPVPASGVVPGLDDRAAARLAEVLALLGRPDGGRAPERLPPPLAARLQRAREKAGRAATPAPPLAQVLAADPAPGALRRAVLAAAPDAVLASEAEVRALLDRPEERVRVAAALALLSTRRRLDAAAEAVLLAAVFDPVEGPDTRELAALRLGTDPGRDEETWRRAFEARR